MSHLRLTSPTHRYLPTATFLRTVGFFATAQILPTWPLPHLPAPPRTSHLSLDTAAEAPRFTYVSSQSGDLIPIGKATKEKLATGLEEYVGRHGQYPDNYPGGPDDISDSEDDDDDLSEAGERVTPTRPTTTSPRATRTMPDVPDSQPPSK